MKLKNIFKKQTQQTMSSKMQTLDKNQLAKVIGGGDGTTIEATAEATKTRAKIIMDRDTG